MSRKSGKHPKHNFLIGKIKLPHGNKSGKHIDCKITLEVDGKPVTQQVGRNRRFAFPLTGATKNSRYVIRAGTCKLGADIYVPVSPSQVFQYDPTVTNDLIVVPFVPAPAQLRVEPRTTGAGGPVAQAGVRVELHDGSSSARLLRRGETTSHKAAVTFRDLKAGDYTVVTEESSTGGSTRRNEYHVGIRPGGQMTILDDRPPAGMVTVEVNVFAGGDPLSGVAVVIAETAGGQPVEEKTSSSSGKAVFVVRSGSYHVRLADSTVRWNDREWAMPGWPVVVTVNESVTLGQVRLDLVPDEPVIYGSVLGRDHKRLPNVRLVASSFPDGDKLATFVSDADGNYRWHAPSPGIYSINYLARNGHPEELAPVQVNSEVELNVRVPDGVDGSGGLPVPESQAFPVMVGEVDIGHGSGRAGPGRGGGSSAGTVVESAIRDVLGWRPRAKDPRGFLAALKQSFTPKEVGGHTEVDWTPRSYAASVQADLGALTGAQASVHQQATLLVEAALPIVDRLEPLKPDPDQEEVAAIRSVVRSRLAEIPRELGAEGGPRVQRLDDLFTRLLGLDLTGSPQIDPDHIQGELGELRDQLGMKRKYVNTLDEETNYTDFLMLVGHAATLFGTWLSQRDAFGRFNGKGGKPFLGTQLVLISRQLEVAAETIGEVYFAMDSVFLGAAERQTVQLRLADEAPITIAELLDWVESFTTEEGPRLITDGGRAGVRSFMPTARRLEELVKLAAHPGQNVPPAYNTARVQAALTQLGQQLEQAADLAQAVC